MAFFKNLVGTVYTKAGSINDPGAIVFNSLFEFHLIQSDL